MTKDLRQAAASLSLLDYVATVALLSVYLVGTSLRSFALVGPERFAKGDEAEGEDD